MPVLPVLPEAPRPPARPRWHRAGAGVDADALEDEELQAEQAAQAQFLVLTLVAKRSCPR